MEGEKEHYCNCIGFKNGVVQVLQQLDSEQSYPNMSPWLNGYWVYLYYYTQSVTGDARYPEDRAANVFSLQEQMAAWANDLSGFLCYGQGFIQITPL